ncbi:MAG TPA: hypothetical protein VHC44_19300 [Verrucomicrobiae bacterium]|nr:hypothetical protein [Verrucomicrobiae bacterium]
MKSSLLRTFFEWALITSVLMSVGFFAWYIIKSHAWREQTSQVKRNQAHLQYLNNVMGALQAECQAYARTNAEMQRLLSPIPAPTAPATTRPGGK